ncbi:MAG: GNAT family N-acetyltransferase, partial [Rhodococcus sp. (in: high G+C Gram-positive bacteria)]
MTSIPITISSGAGGDGALDSCDATALDDPVGGSLRSRHAHLARRHGRAATYLPDVATFSAVAADPEPQVWSDLAHLLGRGALADMFSCAETPPPDWEPVFALEGRQMVWAGIASADRCEAGTDVVVLDAESGPEMRDLVARTRPGPFWTRTPELGCYLGIRENGRLVAMAGERMKLTGFTEV